VYIGTTDTDYPRPVERPEIIREDVEYLLEAVNRTFPDARLQPEHVTAAWAGLRPLIQQEGKSPSEISRRDEIFVSPSGLISIAGGKLTTHRRMAERVMDVVGSVLTEKYGKAVPRRSRTAEVPLTVEENKTSRTDFCAVPAQLAPVDIVHFVEEEMALTVEDVLDRRTSLSLFTPDNGLSSLEQLTSTMAAHCRWDTGRRQKETDAYQSFVHHMKEFCMS
jgi:glycerol-3-phosphate dehydrogenase